MYWRFDEDEQYVELDYPRDIETWRDHKTYYFKEKYFWQFNDQTMEVSIDSPKLIGELWLHCPKKIQDPFKKAQTSQTSLNFTRNSIIFSIIFTMVIYL